MSKADVLASNIIPDVIDDVVEGSGTRISVAFGDSPLEFGQLIPPGEAVATPTVTISGAEDGALYTLINTDPDAPDPANPHMGEILHWVVTNIKGGDVATGDEPVTYIGPRPPIGVHRYIFLLYKQPGTIEFVDPTGGGRRKFKARPTAAAHGLGNPVAVTYFNSSAPPASP